ncbi:hypothetical protein B0H12DRAFT_354979 [Mycena haematopus]|nr:hypothetical protein B0H12DRAFT_354979 [Mycena haematopus]
MRARHALWVTGASCYASGLGWGPYSPPSFLTCPRKHPHPTYAISTGYWCSYALGLPPPRAATHHRTSLRLSNSASGTLHPARSVFTHRSSSALRLPRLRQFLTEQPANSSPTSLRHALPHPPRLHSRDRSARPLASPASPSSPTPAPPRHSPPCFLPRRRSRPQCPLHVTTPPSATIIHPRDRVNPHGASSRIPSLAVFTHCIPPPKSSPPSPQLTTTSSATSIHLRDRLTSLGASTRVLDLTAVTH